MWIELWKDILGYEGYYQVSSQGRIKRLEGFGCSSERILKTNTGNQNQYPRVNLCKKDIPVKTRPVHQLVLESFVGPRPFGCEARHFDGNSCNNSLDNLKYGTHFQNIADSVMHNTHFIPNLYGPNHANSKLTNSEVYLILQLLISGRNNDPGRKYTQKEIGKMFGVNHQTISIIKRGKAWKHIKRK